MSILDLETLAERKEFIAEQLIELDCEEYLEAMSDSDLANVSETMTNIVRLIEENEEDADIDEKLNFLLNYILVLWAEMIVDGGKDSKLL